MDGILVIDKPAGITSHDVVARVRRALRTKRVGHTGTLDPFATGVMVVLVGKATRLAQFLDKDEKEYEAVMELGFETDTGDATGSPKSEVRSPQPLDAKDIEAVLPRFLGEIEQVPPMYSAKKIAGKKLYELARKGETIAREAVKVTISSLRVSVPPAVAGGSGTGPDTLVLLVTCSAGTYIRTLAEDIARAARGRAHLTELRRTRAGRFKIEDAVKLEDVSEQDLLPVELAVEHLPVLELTDERVAKTRSGMSTRVHDAGFADGDHIRMVTGSCELVAIGRYSAEELSLQPKVVLV